MSVDGDDGNDGTITSPFKSLSHAQSIVIPGDTVFIRGGRYVISESEIMKDDGLYARVFDLSKSGTDRDRICYWGYPGERPVFDLSHVKPEERRVSVFYVTGSYLHFKNFEIIGTQVTIKGHTQSECVSARGGSNNIFEHLAMHDGMAIGYYQKEGSDNLVLNCDAYNNYDDYSEGPKGGNVDGFGGHLSKEYFTGNVFRGCRAWWNSDDGFDLINCKASFTIENCYSFYNGYKPGTKNPAGDGTGFKAGGYGMSDNPKVPSEIPMHVVRNCLAFYNKNKGFYSNHHLGGIMWINNTGYMNPSNFCMLNRISADVKEDTDGYGHLIKHNLSFAPRMSEKHIVDVNYDLCEIENNSFFSDEINISANDFVSLDVDLMMVERGKDGCLPDIDFLKAKSESKAAQYNMGYSCEQASDNAGL